MSPEKPQPEASSRRIEGYLKWLYIAKKDLDAARYLLEKSFYPHSVFYLQQSVEKAAKSLGLWLNIIDERDAREKIGHKAYKVYEKLFEKHWRIYEKSGQDTIDFMEKAGLPMSESQKEEFHKFNLELGSSKKLFSRLSDKRETLRTSFSEGLLQYCLTFGRQVKDDLKNEEMEGLAEFDEEEFRSGVARMVPLFLPDSSDSKKFKDKFEKVPTETLVDNHKKFVTFDFEFKYSFLALSVLCLIFTPHETRSRYPCDDPDLILSYNGKMPLTQMLGSFMQLAEETISSLGYVYTSGMRRFLAGVS